jgi:hypothetical protein
VVLLWVVIGCSRGPTVAGVPPPNGGTCEPWAGWGLPVGDEVRVVACDPTQLAGRAPTGSADRLAPAWREALAGAGWAETLENSAAGMIAVQLAPDDDALSGTLSLSLVDDVDHTQIVILMSAER